MNLYKPDRSLPGFFSRTSWSRGPAPSLKTDRTALLSILAAGPVLLLDSISFPVILDTTPPPGGDQRRVSLRGVETKENNHHRHAADSQVEVLLSHPVISVHINASASTCSTCSTCLSHTSAVLQKIILSSWNSPDLCLIKVQVHDHLIIFVEAF